MARQVVEQVSCDKCGKPALAYKIGLLSRTWEVDLCDRHHGTTSVTEAIKIGREVTKLRASERIIPTDRAKLLKSMEVR